MRLKENFSLMSPWFRISLGVLVLTLILTPTRARGDWINLSGAETAPNIAEIYILEDHIRLVLEIYIGDLETFQDLVPNDWLKTRSAARTALAERLKRFSSQTFQFVTENGKKLQAKLKLLEPRLRKNRQSPFAGMINPITRRRVPEPPTDKRVVYAELIYPFQEKPRRLSIIPPTDEKGRVNVTIGFIAYHKAVPIIDFRYLSGPAKVTLNWDDPWYSKFANPNLKRHHKSALMSFLYVEPYEVRHEILARIKDLEQWMDLGLRGDRYIEIDELDPLRKRVGEFLLQKNKVLIDGKSMSPILDRTNYVKVSLTGIQLLERPERLEISTAIVGVIIAFITDGIPKEVTVNWELFTPDIQRVPVTAIDPAGPLLSFVTPEDKIHTWKNFLKNYRPPRVQRVVVADRFAKLKIPVGTLLFLGFLVPVTWRSRGRSLSRSQMGFGAILIAGSILIYPYWQVSIARPAVMAPTLTNKEAHALVQSLLKNVYRAFDFRQENHVYDKLALTVTGDLLNKIYLQNRKSLEIKKAGGAQAKIKKVEILSVSAKSHPKIPKAYSMKSKWTAFGTVGHWGHIHARKNKYEAVLTVKQVGGVWKVAGLELIEEKRVEPYAQPVKKR